jgi:hypothetical protein
MAKNMNELVAGVKTGRGKTEKAKGYAHASEWPKCSHSGCPLPTTIKAETVTCGYHYREHGLSATCITEAIKEHVTFLKKYNEMIFWDVKQWKISKPQIMGWPVLPATEDEMNFPTNYLIRLRSWIDSSITDRAKEIYQDK